MAGLLDDGSSFLNSPGGMGLLSAVAAGLAGARRRQPINTLGAGLLGGLQGYAQAQDQQTQMAFNQQRQKLMDAQLNNYQAEADTRKAGLEKQQRIDAALRSAFEPVKPIDANAASGVVGPRPEALDVVGQRKPVDYQSLIAMGVPMDLVKGLAEAPTLGLPEVARTVESQDAQGNKITLQFDKFGRPVGQGVAGYTPPVQVDLGGRVQFVKPTAGINLTKTMTPGEVASNAVARGNLAVSQQRLALDQQPKPEFRDGQWVVAPKDMKPGESRQAVAPGAKPLTDSQAKAYLFGTRMQEADKLIGQLADQGVDRRGNIKSAAEAVPFIGDGLGSLLNFTQSDAQQKVEQAKRDFINAVMRRESGAAIAPIEFDSADKQYFPQIGDSAAVKQQKAQNRQLAVQGIMAEVPGNQMPAQPQSQPQKQGALPTQGAVVDGYVFRGGNPADPHNWAKVK